MNIIDFYTDYQIPFITQGNKHCTKGWVQTHCPFCPGGQDYHLGFCLDKTQVFYDKWVCWRCGGKRYTDVIQRLVRVDERQAIQIMRKYHQMSGGPVFHQPAKIRIANKAFKFPSLTKEGLGGAHTKYLLKRKFDPDKVQKEWGLKHTEHLSFLDKIDFRWRIVIPIYNPAGDVVSFQSRDITGKSQLKYISSPMEREVEHHKHLLYGFHKIESTSLIIVSEGVTDVWRMGPPTTASFGVNLKPAQVRLLSQFDHVILLFDPDAAGQGGADKVTRKLRWAGRRVSVHSLADCDPGDLTDGEARNLLRELSTRIYAIGG